VTAIAVIQFQDDAGPGLLEDWALQRGLSLDVFRPDRGDALPPDPGAAVILGSDRSIAGDEQPFGPQLLDWTAAVLHAQTPVLGICFGAQTMARALGADVVRLPTPEIGWFSVASHDGVGAGPWLEWHEDGIAEHEALRVVATNERGIQAYRTGAGQLGVQFHPEVTPEIVAGWSAIDGAARGLAAAGTNAEALVRQTERCASHAEPAAMALFDGWAREAGLRSA
jgi:GMP synthase-like glutamine amidotransferase